MAIVDPVTQTAPSPEPVVAGLIHPIAVDFDHTLIHCDTLHESHLPQSFACLGMKRP